MAQDTRCTHLQCVGGPQYRHCALRPSRPPAARRGAWMLLHRSGTPGAERVCGSRDGLGVGVGRNSQVGVLAFRIEARAGLTDFREVPVALYDRALVLRSEENTSEFQSLMRISYAVFCLKKQRYNKKIS